MILLRHSGPPRGVVKATNKKTFVLCSLCNLSNRPFPSCHKPLFQGEAHCRAIDKKTIFHSHANETHFLHLASFSRWGFLKLGNGLFRYHTLVVLYSIPLEVHTPYTKADLRYIHTSCKYLQHQTGKRYKPSIFTFLLLWMTILKLSGLSIKILDRFSGLSLRFQVAG